MGAESSQYSCYRTDWGRQELSCLCPGPEGMPGWSHRSLPESATAVAGHSRGKA